MSGNVLKPQPNKQKPQGRVSPTASEQVVSTQNEKKSPGSTGTCENQSTGHEVGTGPWGQIRGKLGKLQALRDAMIEVKPFALLFCVHRIWLTCIATGFLY